MVRMQKFGQPILSFSLADSLHTIQGLDSQEPSTNGISASNLTRLGSMLGDNEFVQYARKTCSAFSAEILEHPSMFSSLMSSVVAANIGMRAIVLAGGRNATDQQLQKIRSQLLPNTTVVVLHDDMVDGEDSRWLLDANPALKAALDSARKGGGSIVQVCEGAKCLAVDTFDMSELHRALGVTA